ncbi:hypothetical protein [Synechococcus sp. LA31]|uniref:hypothetical protein n=1 Tax=Synechococcus sp. LA31 TaxID=2741953 RepID=UPI001BDD56D0|nr:hypothetical protein [Synechococcus sp. LA31]QVV66543.1 hypothetical protein KJJ24_08385 [Synechococcus sp. LA31]
MVLPTRVNIINDSSERIKVKIDNDRDRKFDEITNIEPGSRLDGIEGSVWGPGKFDVIVDIISNPAGPNNNTRFGGFKFDNPSLGYPNVRSDDFTTLSLEDERYILLSKVNRSDRIMGLPKGYWGKFDSSLLDMDKTPWFGEQEKLLIKSAPKPTFTIESFDNNDEVGAKVWDLHVNSDNFNRP